LRMLPRTVLSSRQWCRATLPHPRPRQRPAGQHGPKPRASCIAPQHLKPLPSPTRPTGPV